MFTLQVRKLFRKTLVFWSTTPQQPKRPPTRLGLEALEDRTLLSVMSLPVVSPEAESPLAVATSSLFALVEQRVQQFATIVQYASNVVNTLNWEIVQEVAGLQLQVGHILGFDTNTPIPSSNAAVLQPSSESGASQGRASGFGSSSGAATKAHDDPHPRLEKAVPLTDSGVGSGNDSGPHSGSATVTGQVWLDNNAGGSQDNGEMDYSGATVDLLKSTDSGQTWSFAGSDITSGAKQGYNYSLPTGFPLPNDWLYKIQVIFPTYFAATTPIAQSVINAEGFSPVFGLTAGQVKVIPAGIVSMNVNTTDDDPNGPQLQQVLQNKVTLRDAILTGNNLKPFPAVTFYTNPQTGQQLSGSIGLQKALPSIQKSYNITGPGAATLTVNGNNVAGTIFTVNAGVTSTISGLTITGGSGADGGGISNNGTLSLNGDKITNNQATLGGGIANLTGAQLSLQQVSIQSKNRATKGGGGGLANFGTVTIYDGVVIDGNTSANGGAGIDNSGGTITANSFIEIDGNTDEGSRGGGVFNAGKFQILDGGSISDDTSLGYGGGVANSGGTMTLQGVSVQGTASQNGGGIYANGGSLTLTDVTISVQSKAYEGGGMYVKGGTVKMSGGAISKNGASYRGGASGVPGGGGGLFVGGGSVTLTGVSIKGNLSAYEGGGVFNSAGTLTLDNVNIGSNNAAHGGGGMYLSKAGPSTTNFNGVTVSGNTVDDAEGSIGGPGVYWSGNAVVNPDPPTPPELIDNDDPGLGPVHGP